MRDLILGVGSFLSSILVAVVMLHPSNSTAQESSTHDPIKMQALEFLTVEQLKALSEDPYPDKSIRAKLQSLWSDPMISNEAYYRGVSPHKPVSDSLGSFMRVVSWNIEKSIEMGAAIDAFRNTDAFAKRLDNKKAPIGSKRYSQTMDEQELLKQADVILLQEMDIGIKRSGYRNASGDLARALDMNYAYLPAQVEVDPVLLGMESVAFEEGQPDVEATEYYNQDPKQYRGLFGLAVLSRYPIIFAEGFQLFNQAYDWYWQEKQKPTYLEHARRLGARGLFRKVPHREIKLGGRSYFRVDIRVPDLPEGRVSIINVHLEIKAKPQARAMQMAEILNYIKDIRHPVILAGDFNSAPQDLSPTSTPKVIDRALAAPEFWFNRVFDHVTPYALVVNITRAISNLTKNYQNPTAWHVPILFPNRSAELFRLIQRFRFQDDGAFDFRGDKKRSVGRIGKLSNSNERDRWAYKTSFRVNQRTLTNWVGTYRLDWIFVKAYLKHPRDRSGSYRFAPHFGRTLNTLNRNLKISISDHDPLVVDLPLGEAFL